MLAGLFASSGREQEPADSMLINERGTYDVYHK